MDLSKYTILKWVGRSDYKSRIGVESWEKCFATNSKRAAEIKMTE